MSHHEILDEIIHPWKFKTAEKAIFNIIDDYCNEYRFHVNNDELKKGLSSDLRKVGPNFFRTNKPIEILPKITCKDTDIKLLIKADKTYVAINVIGYCKDAEITSIIEWNVMTGVLYEETKKKKKIVEKHNRRVFFVPNESIITCSYDKKYKFLSFKCGYHSWGKHFMSNCKNPIIECQVQLGYDGCCELLYS